MTRHRTVFNRRRSFADRHDVRDLSASIAIRVRPLRAAYRPPRAKMPKQLFLKYPTGLNK